MELCLYDIESPIASKEHIEVYYAGNDCHISVVHYAARSSRSTARGSSFRATHEIDKEDGGNKQSVCVAVSTSERPSLAVLFVSRSS